jgi:hypothetical protein
MFSTRYIVGVKLMDTLNRPVKETILGVWPTLEQIPVDLIRKVNEQVYPDKQVHVYVNAYSEVPL